MSLYPGAVEAMLNAAVYTSGMRQHLRMRDCELTASAFFIHCTVLASLTQDLSSYAHDALMMSYQGIEKLCIVTPS